MIPTDLTSVHFGILDEYFYDALQILILQTSKDDALAGSDLSRLDVGNIPAGSH